MQITNATSFRKKLFSMLENTIKYNEPIVVTTKDGNAVMMSEEDYNGLIETLYLCSIPGMKESIIEAGETPISECYTDEEVW